MICYSVDNNKKDCQHPEGSEMEETIEQKLLSAAAAKKINDQINGLVVNEKVLAKLELDPKEAKKVLLRTILEATNLLLQEVEE